MKISVDILEREFEKELMHYWNVEIRDEVIEYFRRALASTMNFELKEQKEGQNDSTTRKRNSSKD